ncbi:HNH endonuclease domain-containing protein [Halorhodospira abdelmalekii]|uniref:HNH endonuclease domain-containing protein n=1 Tax=Halorhodospira abdelmalekii TaxID=421629 RepID=UPI001903CC58|nr:HNH endonuclease domain-containing protein [Halorhodospira abdelmalekii]
MAQLQSQGVALRCVWSDRPLRPGNADIDHCFPWSAWSCDDLWNLLPSHHKINRQKSDRLPTADMLELAREPIQEWWSLAYQQGET